MKAHIGMDSQEKVIRTVKVSAANVADALVLPHLLHGEMWGPTRAARKQIVVSLQAGSVNPRLQRLSGLIRSFKLHGRCVFCWITMARFATRRPWSPAN
jgi:hypothetical protein